MDMPLVNTKCASAVNTSIADMAILPDNANSNLPRITLVVKRETANTASKTSNGFISFGSIKVKDRFS